METWVDQFIRKQRLRLSPLAFPALEQALAAAVEADRQGLRKLLRAEAERNEARVEAAVREQVLLPVYQQNLSSFREFTLHFVRALLVRADRFSLALVNAPDKLFARVAPADPRLTADKRAEAAALVRNLAAAQRKATLDLLAEFSYEKSDQFVEAFVELVEQNSSAVDGHLSSIGIAVDPTLAIRPRKGGATDERTAAAFALVLSNWFWLHQQARLVVAELLDRFRPAAFMPAEEAAAFAAETQSQALELSLEVFAGKKAMYAAALSALVEARCAAARAEAEAFLQEEMTGERRANLDCAGFVLFRKHFNHLVYVFNKSVEESLLEVFADEQLLHFPPVSRTVRRFYSDTVDRLHGFFRDYFDNEAHLKQVRKTLARASAQIHREGFAATGGLDDQTADQLVRLWLFYRLGRFAPNARVAAILLNAREQLEFVARLREVVKAKNSGELLAKTADLLEKRDFAKLCQLVESLKPQQIHEQSQQHSQRFQIPVKLRQEEFLRLLMELFVLHFGWRDELQFHSKLDEVINAQPQGKAQSGTEEKAEPVEDKEQKVGEVAQNENLLLENLKREIPVEKPAEKVLQQKEAPEEKTQPEIRVQKNPAEPETKSQKEASLVPQLKPADQLAEESPLFMSKRSAESDGAGDSEIRSLFPPLRAAFLRFVSHVNNGVFCFLNFQVALELEQLFHRLAAPAAPLGPEDAAGQRAALRAAGQEQKLELHRLSACDSLTAILSVSGFLSEDTDKRSEWKEVRWHQRGAALFALNWAAQNKEQVNRFLRDQALDVGQSLGSIALFSFSQRLSLVGLGLQTLYSMYKNNPFTQAVVTAARTGRALAALAAAGLFRHQALSLVGFSLGTVLTLEFLLQLLEAGVPLLVQDVILMGSCLDLAAFEAALPRLLGPRGVVKGRLYVFFSNNDGVLRYLFKASKWSENALGFWGCSADRVAQVLKQADADLAHLSLKDVRAFVDLKYKCFDVSEFVEGHYQYRAKSQRILEEISFNVDFETFLDSPRPFFLDSDILVRN